MEKKLDPDNSKLDAMIVGVRLARSLLPLLVVGAIGVATVSCVAVRISWPLIGPVLEHAHVDGPALSMLGCLLMLAGGLHLFCIDGLLRPARILAGTIFASGLLCAAVAAALGCDGPFILIGGGACR